MEDKRLVITYKINGNKKLEFEFTQSLSLVVGWLLAILNNGCLLYLWCSFCPFTLWWNIWNVFENFFPHKLSLFEKPFYYIRPKNNVLEKLDFPTALNTNVRMSFVMRPWQTTSDVLYTATLLFMSCYAILRALSLASQTRSSCGAGVGNVDR